MDAVVDDRIKGTVASKQKLAFDPLGDLFVAQSVKPAHVEPINLRALSPFQRALLVIDGTVTKFIEAYTMEPVDVVRLNQEPVQLDHEHEWLEVPQGETVVARQVLLRGRYSYTFHAYAVSLIVPERLGTAAAHLAENGAGLGGILLDRGMETRREVLWYGKEGGDQVPKAVRDLGPGEFLSRTYRIIFSGKPVMLINERFPYGIRELPAHT
jgi:chorismate-pyruvate lyase